MLRKHCVAVLLLALTSSLAFASGDFGCGTPAGAIFFSSYYYCSSVPFLSPSNDSRLNLELLLIDAGRLKGSLYVPQYDARMPDFVPLQVPFSFGDWEVHETETTSATTNPGANSTAPSTGYAEGEGSRCNTAASGLAEFRAAVITAGVPKEDAATLLEIRSKLTGGCNGTTAVEFKLPQDLRSALSHDFATYIAGANAFYAGDFANATKAFESLKNSANPWLKETSRYMVGRTLLNSAQSSAFGKWGELNLASVDKDSLQRAQDAFNSYLHDYPQGLYAASARGLLRRMYWLAGDQTHLAEAFDRALLESAKTPNNVTIAELVQEADTKLIAFGSAQIDQIKSPLFLAVVDLMRMRSSRGQPGAPNTDASLKLSELEKQKPRFAGNPALYNYLLAAFHLYVDNKPAEALTLLPDLSHSPLNYLAFSQQTLRLLALEAEKQYDRERQLVLEMWPLAKLPLQREQLQLVLARIDVLSGHSDRIFAPDSLVQDKAIRTIVVEYTASPEMLRQRIKDPKESPEVVNAALYTLLHKELTEAKYAAFESDLALVPPHPQELLAPFVAPGEGKSAYACPSMKQVAATLQRDPNDARSLNCVGELVRLHGVHYGQRGAPTATDLGGVGSLFPVTNYSRLDGYMKVIANPKAEPDARAYALYRAVSCFGYSGNNGCGSQDIPKSTRKQWFTTLHREYPNSTWARQSKYYW